MNFRQIFRVCLPQEDLELIRFWGVSGNNCCHGNRFLGLKVCGCSTFVQNVNGQESLCQSNCVLVLETKWPPYHIVNAK